LIDCRRCRLLPPQSSGAKNLRALCQRCHMLHDRPHHLAQRWITYRRRLAAGDLFLGPYPVLIPGPPAYWASYSARLGGFRTARVERDVVPCERPKAQ
jgi:hypothetical protein